MEFIAKKYKNLKVSALVSSSDDVNNSENIIDLSLGDHDINTDERIMESASCSKYIKHTRYTHPLGDEIFRNEIINYNKNMYSINIEQDQIMATVGAGHGLYVGLKCIIDNEDEVIVIGPYYPAYMDQLQGTNAKCVIIDTKFENNYIPSIEGIKAKINKNTKAIIINSPSNPTGAIYSKKLLEDIYKLSVENNFMILSDEVYTTFIYGENKFTSMLEIDKNLTNTAVFKTMSKDYAMTGWRIGYMIGSRQLISVARYVNDGITYSAPTICQNGAIEALKLGNKVTDKLRDIYEERINYAYERIENIDNLVANKPQGGIYLFVDVSKTNLNGSEFTEALLKNDILVLPGEIFGDNYKNYIRITCNKDVEILEQVFNKIENICNCFIS